MCDTKKYAGTAGIQYHPLPKIPHLRKLWLEGCGRNNDWGLRNIFICSEHFAPDDYENIVRSGPKSFVRRKKLKTYAVPTQKLGNGMDNSKDTFSWPVIDKVYAQWKDHSSSPVNETTVEIKQENDDTSPGGLVPGTIPCFVNLSLNNVLMESTFSDILNMMKSKNKIVVGNSIQSHQQKQMSLVKNVGTARQRRNSSRSESQKKNFAVRKDIQNKGPAIKKESQKRSPAVKGRESNSGVKPEAPSAKVETGARGKQGTSQSVKIARSTSERSSAVQYNKSETMQLEQKKSSLTETKLEGPILCVNLGKPVVQGLPGQTFKIEPENSTIVKKSSTSKYKRRGFEFSYRKGRKSRLSATKRRSAISHSVGKLQFLNNRNKQNVQSRIHSVPSAIKPFPEESAEDWELESKEEETGMDLKEYTEIEPPEDDNHFMEITQMESPKKQMESPKDSEVEQPDDFQMMRDQDEDSGEMMLGTIDESKLNDPVVVEKKQRKQNVNILGFVPPVRRTERVPVKKKFLGEYESPDSKRKRRSLHMKTPTVQSELHQVKTLSSTLLRSPPTPLETPSVALELSTPPLKTPSPLSSKSLTAASVKSPYSLFVKSSPTPSAKSPSSLPVKSLAMAPVKTQYPLAAKSSTALLKTSFPLSGKSLTVAQAKTPSSPPLNSATAPVKTPSSLPVKSSVTALVKTSSSLPVKSSATPLVKMPSSVPVKPSPAPANVLVPVASPPVDERCFVCDKPARGGVSVHKLTGSSKIHIHEKLDKILGVDKLTLKLEEDGVLCSRCALLLNYVDRIEVELSMLNKAILNCVRPKCTDQSKLSEAGTLKNISKTQETVKEEHQGKHSSPLSSPPSPPSPPPSSSPPLPPPPPKHVCRICRFKTPYESLMIFHLRQHLKVSSYRCDFCNCCLQASEALKCLKAKERKKYAS